MSKLTKELLVVSLIFGLIGGLMGFGVEGTIQSACLGAGIGGALPFVLLIMYG